MVLHSRFHHLSQRFHILNHSLSALLRCCSMAVATLTLRCTANNSPPTRSTGLCLGMIKLNLQLFVLRQQRYAFAMTSIDIHSGTVGQVTTRLFIISFAGLASLTALANTSVADTLRVSLVVAVQVCTGATMWRLFRPRQICTMPELIGMGLALGSFVSLLSSRMLRVTPLNEVAWALPTIFFAIVIGLPRFRDRLASSRIEKTSPLTFLVITTATLIALTFWWWWLWPIVPTPAVLYFLITARTTQKRFSIPVAALLLFGMVALAIWFRGFNSTWWVFSNDQVFSESLSISLTVWGPNENIQLAGEPIRYHWFALAWAGMTTQAGGIGSWVVMTKVLPILSFFGAICLTWTCTRAITRSRFAPTISVFVFVLASNPFNFTPTRFIHSPTFLFSMIWLLGFTLILIEGVNFRISNGEFLLGLMMVASLGGKVSSGVIAFGGFALCLVASLVFIRDKRLTRFLLTSAAWLAVACLVTFLVLYRNQTIGTGYSNLSLGFAQIGAHLGIAAWDSSMLVRSIAWSGVIASFIPAMAPILILFLLPSTRHRAELYYFVGAILSSLVLVSIFSHGGASQLFFFLAGLVVSSIGVGWALGEGWDQLQTRVARQQVAIAILIGVCFSVLSSLLWNWTPSRFDPYRFSFVIKVMLQPVLWASALAAALLLCRHKDTAVGRRSTYQIRAYVASIILVASAMSFGIVERYDVTKNQGHKVVNNSNDPDLITGSKDHVAALTWLRKHSDQDDVVATNRFCNPGVQPCLPKWFLVSALSHRRMLLEGGYFHAAEPPSWAADKMKYSQDFAEHPTRKGTDWLLDQGVSWVFVDYVAQGSGIRTWEPYGTTMFSNSAVSIVKLHPVLQK